MTNEITKRNASGSLAPLHGEEFGVNILAGQVTDSSKAMYERDFKAYLAYAGDFQTAMQHQTLARWRSYLVDDYTYTLKDEERKLSPRTINRMLSAVRKLMKEAAAQGYTTNEVATAFKHVDGVKVVAMGDRTRKHNKTKIGPDEMTRICYAPDTDTLAGKMHHAFLLTLATCGMRVAEAVELTMEQISFGTDDEGNEGYVVMVAGKNKLEATERNIGKDAVAAIETWMTARQAETDVKSEYIFTGFSGRGSRGPRDTHIHSVSAWEMVKRYAKVAGVEHVKPHDFRRFVGTRLVKTNGLRAAQMQLGHKNIATTADNYDLSEIERGQTDDILDPSKMSRFTVSKLIDAIRSATDLSELQAMVA